MGARRTWIIAAALAAGVLAGDRMRGYQFQSGFTISVVLGVGGFLLLAIAWWVHRARVKDPGPQPGELLPKLSRVAAACLLSGVALVGFGNLGMRMAAMDGSPFPVGIDGNGKAMEVEGYLVRDPLPLSPRSTRIEIKTNKVDGVRANWRVAASVFGHPHLTKRLMIGDTVRMSGLFRPLVQKDRFDYTMMRRGVVAEATVSSGDIEKIHEAGGLLAIANHMRSRMLRLTAHLKPEQAGLILGLTIGADEALPDELRDDMRTTGLTHLTAVSGANVAIVLAAVVLVLRAVRASRRSTVIVGLAVIGMFVLVARWEPSVLRAALMAGLGLIAYLVGRRSNPFNAAGVAFAGLIAIDPFIMWSIGFQLSFAATLGILLLAPALTQRFQGVLHRWKRLPDWAVSALAVGLAAQVAVTPLIAFVFGRISISSPIANLAAFPLVAPITVLGMLGGLAGTLWLPLGVPFMAAAGISASMLSSIARFFAAAPLSSIGVGDVGLFPLLLIYGVVGAAVLWIRGTSGWARRIVIVVALLWIATLVTPASSTTPRGLEIRFFDVGQGESALVSSPGGARILIDGGPDEDFVASRLEKLGIGRLDLVVFSHAHSDHIVGLREVLDQFEVRVAVYPGIGRILPTGVGERTRFHSVDTIADGQGLVIGDVNIRALGPSADLLATARDQSMDGEGAGLNDASVVLRVAWRETCVLFTGDVEEGGQDALATRHRSDIDCEIMKAPHHGSPRIVEEFVEIADPEFVVVSVGKNDYGHPSRKALSTFERAGARVLRTDRVGDIVLLIDEYGRIKI